MHAMWAAFYVYQHLNRGYAEGYFVGLLLLGVLVAWAAQAIARPQPRAPAG
jgi:hypothetical protein